MKKIKTIFDRDWEGSRGVVNKPQVNLDYLKECKATEKLDGTNVRITFRSNLIVRVERRRNPDKLQKAKGIEEPWYMDADSLDPQDKWIFDALKNISIKDIPDGEWSGECIGKNIQGNPLNLEKNTVVFFSLGQAPVFENVPVTFDELREWLPKQKSKFGNDCGVEGIVWHSPAGEMYKIKVKDFK